MYITSGSPHLRKCGEIDVKMKSLVPSCSN